MYTKRETATILAALLYWREELSSHGRCCIGRPAIRSPQRPAAVWLGECRRLSRHWLAYGAAGAAIPG